MTKARQDFWEMWKRYKIFIEEAYKYILQLTVS